MSVASPARSKPGISAAARTGLLLAVLLGASDIVFGTFQLVSGDLVPAAVSATSIIAGVVTVAAVPAWRGVTWCVWLIVAVRSLAALTALRAFFVGEVPAEAIFLAAASVLITAVLVVLLLMRPRTAS